MIVVVVVLSKLYIYQKKKAQSGLQKKSKNKDTVKIEYHKMQHSSNKTMIKSRRIKENKRQRRSVQK